MVQHDACAGGFEDIVESLLAVYAEKGGTGYWSTKQDEFSIAMICFSNLCNHRALFQLELALKCELELQLQFDFLAQCCSEQTIRQ